MHAVVLATPSCFLITQKPSAAPRGEAIHHHPRPFAMLSHFNCCSGLHVLRHVAVTAETAGALYLLAHAGKDHLAHHSATGLCLQESQHTQRVKYDIITFNSPGQERGNALALTLPLPSRTPHTGEHTLSPSPSP
jgi:hypothetical protein